jgi:hypothetical protein
LEPPSSCSWKTKEVGASNECNSSRHIRKSLCGRIIVKPGRMNKGPDHLSRLEHGEEPTSLEDTLLDAQLLAIRKIDDHFTEIVQFLSTGMAPSEYTIPQKK